MNNDIASGNKEQAKEDARTWEGGFGRHRFRAQWEHGPKHARFHFQGPFTEEYDPDGIGTPFSPDFGFEWEHGRGARAYSEYEAHLNDLREKAERTARRTAKQARRSAKRITRHMRDTNWNAVEREVLTAVENVMTELEEALTNMRRGWSKRQAEVQSPGSVRSSKGQRVRIEYEPADDTADESDAPASSANIAASTQLSREERTAQRRTILEELRNSAISLEEAERRLNELG